MKYEVIGWTYCGNDEYPPHEKITAGVDNAIIKEIRKHNYLFGGDSHEDYCPVLNDGTYAEYSWRGWGRIMALAHGVTGENAYMLGYMDSLIKPEARKYPEGVPDGSRIVLKESIAETFVMHLAAEPFEKVKAGTKTVEIRLFDDKRNEVDIGDYIEFIKSGDENERVIRRVADVEIWQSFENAFSRACYENKKRVECLRYTPEQLGSPAGSDLKSLVGGMYKYYNKAEERKHGVIAFTLEKPRHLCSTRVWLSAYSPENEKLFSDRLADPDLGDEEFQRLEDECYDSDLLEEAVSELSFDYTRRANSFTLAYNDEYEPNVNAMLRKTLQGLFGRERELKRLRERFCKIITLEIFAVIIKESEEPKQILSLEEDITEFLHASGVELKLGYREV